MRPIKFRAWTEIEHEVLGMKYGVHHDYNNFVMQFTGLKDKNGKEIYEGDILKGENPEYEDYGGVYNNVIVKWDKHSDTMDYRWNYYGYCLPDNTDEYVVIGNIWEHPKLINNK